EKLLKEKNGVAAALERAAPALSQALAPKTDLERNELKLRLANAGFNNPSAASIFLAVKLIMLAIGLIGGAGTGYALYGFKLNGWLAIVFGAGAGFYLPEVALSIIKKGRQEKLFLQLPDALDLLVVCVEAGLGLDAGMRRVAEELKEAGPE